MGRPAKNNAEYFPHYTSMRNHRKIKALRNKFGPIQGYAFWVMMLEWLTEQDGIEWEYSELECEMFAAELGVSAAEIRDMVDFCLRVELLFKTESGFIYSESLNEYLKAVFEKRQRERDKSKTRKRREDGQFTDDNTTGGGVSAAEMPQSKVKESKVDNSKVEESKVKHNLPSGEGLPSEKSAIEVLENCLSVVDPTTLNADGSQASQTGGLPNYHKMFTDAYCEFYEGRVGVKPDFTKADGVAAAGLRKFLKDNCREQTEEGALNSLRFIFHNWDKMEPFLQDQMKLSQIKSNINNIMNQVKNGTARKHSDIQNNGNRLDVEEAVRLARLLA